MNWAQIMVSPVEPALRMRPHPAISVGSSKVVPPGPTPTAALSLTSPPPTQSSTNITAYNDHGGLRDHLGAFEKRSLLSVETRRPDRRSIMNRTLEHQPAFDIHGVSGRDRVHSQHGRG